MPKKHAENNMNDFRPNAPTSCLMKVFEKCITSHVTKLLAISWIPTNYAYKAKRGVDYEIRQT